MCRKFGFSDFLRVEADGFSGGILILWDASRIDLEIAASSSQLIHALVTTNKQQWLLTAIYACPKPEEKTKLWDSLRLASEINSAGSGRF